VLTKGVVGLLLPLLAIGIFLAVETIPRADRHGAARWIPSRRVGWERIAPCIRRMRPLPGLLLFFALAAPWHVAIWRAGGLDARGHTWVREYVVNQHVGRFRGTDTVHNAPPPSYIVYFLIGFFPWALFTPAAMYYRDCTSCEPSSEPDTGGDEAGRNWSVHRFLLVWFWTIFIFFSISAAKLPNYITPIYPAASLLVGRWLDRAIAACRRRPAQDPGAESAPADDAAEASALAACLRGLRRATGSAAVIGLLLFAAVLAAQRHAPATVPPAVFPLARAIASIMLACSLAAWLTLCLFGHAKRARSAAIGILGMTMPIACLLILTTGYNIAERDILGPYQELARFANRDAERGVPIVYYDIVPRRPSMLFFARYSPFELPAPLVLRMLDRVAPGSDMFDLIMSLDTLDRKLRPEVDSSHGWQMHLLKRTGGRAGWAIVRLTRSGHTGTAAATLHRRDRGGR
jgi:4-amino-4-deoxy-L-arabinose transferase-like glycosyltransferase